MGSSSSKASRQAQKAEDERRRQIEQTQSRIEGIFSSPEREADIQKYIDAVSGYQQLGLDREKAINDRELKFALARGGLAGGSTAIDQNRKLSEAFLRATIEAERRAQGAGNQIRQSDQQAKYNLFNQALGGLDMTTATSNAMREMQNNIGLAKNTATENNFDQFFSDFGDLFTASRKSAGERKQQEEFGTLYGTRPVQTMQIAGGQ